MLWTIRNCSKFLLINEKYFPRPSIFNIVTITIYLTLQWRTTLKRCFHLWNVKRYFDVTQEGVACNNGHKQWEKSTYCNSILMKRKQIPFPRDILQTEIKQCTNGPGVTNQCYTKLFCLLSSINKYYVLFARLYHTTVKLESPQVRCLSR